MLYLCFTRLFAILALCSFFDYMMVNKRSKLFLYRFIFCLNPKILGDVKPLATAVVKTVIHEFISQ